MHRSKIGLVSVGGLVVVTLLLYLAVRQEAVSRSDTTVRAGVQRAERLFRQITRLEGEDLAKTVAEQAVSPDLVAIADLDSEEERRAAANTSCDTVSETLAKAGRRPDIVAILAPDGLVVARDRDLSGKAMYGRNLREEHPAVSIALSGRPAQDIWRFDGRSMRAALAPISAPDGTINGVLMVGYVISAVGAREKSSLLGTELAYFHEGKVITSSFSSAGVGETDREDNIRTRGIETVLFDSTEKWGQKALERGGPTEVFRAEIDGELFAVVAAPLLLGAADKTSGFVVLSSMGSGRSWASRLSRNILIVGVLGILAVLATLFLTAQGLIAPLDKIELGVSEIINGNIDYVFKPVGADFEGLSNGLNVVLGRLLGREDAADEEGVDEDDEKQRWRGSHMKIDVRGGGDEGPLAGDLGQESEAAYYPRLYREYVAALQDHGLPNRGITVQAFMAKLRLTEAGLKARWSCRMVRFRVIQEDSTVSLKAVRIA